MEANPAVRPPDGRRTVLSFGLASFLLFSVLFLGSRTYLVTAGNGRDNPWVFYYDESLFCC